MVQFSLEGALILGWTEDEKMILARKIIAVLMILFSIISLAVSAFFAVKLWTSQATLSEKLVDNLTQISETLTTTDRGLVVVNETLDNISGSVGTLSDTTLTLADNVNKTSSTIDSFGSLFNEDIPTTITNTQEAIFSAQLSAAVIDGLLSGLSNVPLIGLDYNPEESLSSALGDVADSLDPLPASIKGIGDDLDSMGSSMLTLQTDIQVISEDISTISKNLEDAQGVVTQYQAQIDQLESGVSSAIEQAPNWVKFMVWAVTFLLLWLMVAQVGLLVQGIRQFNA
jgi:uncharacterized phage infection (PIP) family protein YhgE